jgi:hypothetical protein
MNGRFVSDLPQLQRETISAREIRPNRFAVEITYYMRGATETALRGAFPVRRSLPLQNFRAYLGGREIAVIVEDLAGREACLAGQCFELLYRYPIASEKAEWVMVNTFEFDAPEFSLKGSPMRYRTFEYILRTGSAWRGKIEDFTMQIDFLRPVCSQLITDGYRGKCLTDRTWKTQMRNFEPDRDILLRIPEVSQ